MMNFNAPDVAPQPVVPMTIGQLLAEIAALKAAGLGDDESKIMMSAGGIARYLQSVIIHGDRVMVLSSKSEAEITAAGEGQVYQEPEQDDQQVQSVKRRKIPAFMELKTPSAELAKIIGPEPRLRTEVTKKFWEYIKQHGLQNQANKRMVDADALLKPIFGKDQVSMFEMTKLLNAHLK